MYSELRRSTLSLKRTEGFFFLFFHRFLMASLKQKGSGARHWTSFELDLHNNTIRQGFVNSGLLLICIQVHDWTSRDGQHGIRERLSECYSYYLDNFTYCPGFHNLVWFVALHQHFVWVHMWGPLVVPTRLFLYFPPDFLALAGTNTTQCHRQPH